MSTITQGFSTDEARPATEVNQELTLDQEITNDMNELHETHKSKSWDPNSIYYKWKQLTPDGKGKLGEKVIVRILKRLILSVSSLLSLEWDGDKSIKDDGKFDIKLIIKTLESLFGLRIEVKTSCSETIQMEPVYAEDFWDVIIGIRVQENSIDFIILDRDKTEYALKPILVKDGGQHVVLGVAAHLRQENKEGYKLDVAKCPMQRAMEKGLAFNYIPGVTSEASLFEFFKDRLSVCSGINL